MSSREAPVVPPPLPRWARRPSRPIPPSYLAAFVLFLAGLVGVECAWLRGRQEVRVAARATERVAARIEAARTHLAGRQWEEAICQLEDALNEEHAINLDEVQSVLEQAWRSQADALLQAATRAIEGKDAVNALLLLRAYDAHPGATEREHARLLRADVERATSSAEAARTLAGLSDDALTAFAVDGQLPKDGGLHAEGVREILKDTMRRQLAREMQQRQAKRDAERRLAERRAAEHARRIAHVRATPAFRALSASLARTLAAQRDQQELARRQELELAQLFQQLDVNDRDEQATIRADLLGGVAHGHRRVR